MTPDRAEILPYPDLPHKDVVARILARQKPFGTKGDNGYRDLSLAKTNRALWSVSRQRVSGQNNEPGSRMPTPSDLRERLSASLGSHLGVGASALVGFDESFLAVSSGGLSPFVSVMQPTDARERNDRPATPGRLRDRPRHG